MFGPRTFGTGGSSVLRLAHSRAYAVVVDNFELTCAKVPCSNCGPLRNGTVNTCRRLWTLWRPYLRFLANKPAQSFSNLISHFSKDYELPIRRDSRRVLKALVQPWQRRSRWQRVCSLLLQPPPWDARGNRGIDVQVVSAGFHGESPHNHSRAENPPTVGNRS
jgi:hypothetical protein